MVENFTNLLPRAVPRITTRYRHRAEGFLVHDAWGNHSPKPRWSGPRLRETDRIPPSLYRLQRLGCAAELPSARDARKLYRR
jgi:hypothetical protein